jgi:caffeoyl-CoA O-methyltransferase
LSALDDYAAARSSPLPDRMGGLARETAQRLGSPGMMSGPVVARLLQTLVFALRPRLVVELGTFSGYSAQAMAAVLPPGGRIVTCEVSPERAAFARRHMDAGPYGDRIEIRVGPALETLAGLREPVDLAYVDADKDAYVDYYEALVPRLGEHGLLVADNTLRGGRVLDPGDEAGRELYAFNRHVRDDERTVAVLLTVRDGVTLVRRR